jgi:hypothetical protein
LAFCQREEPGCVQVEAGRLCADKLYLNYNAKVQSDWERDVPGHVGKGDRNWPAVLGK